MSQIGLSITGNLKSLVGDVVADAKLKTIYVVEEALDEMAIEVELVPFYPCNKITIRLII